MADEQQQTPQQAETKAEGKQTQTESADTPSPVPEGDAASQPDSKESGSEPTVEDSKLPDDASDRTKEQFQKLTKSNQELKGKLDQYEQLVAETRKRQFGEDALSSLRPQGNFREQVQQQPQQVQNRVQKARQAGVTADQLVDEQGMLDVNKLNQVIQQVNQTAAKAAMTAQQAEKRAYERFDEQQQVQEAHSEYPSIDPQSEKFNQEHYNNVQALIMHSMVRPDLYGGNQLRLSEAAKRVVSPDSKEQKQAFKEGAKTAMENLTPKEQASLDAQTRSDKRGQQVDREREALETRRGNEKVIAERIRRATSS